MNKNNTIILSRITNKFTLVIFEHEKYILDKYSEYIFASFKNVYTINKEDELYKLSKEKSIDFLFIHMNDDSNSHNFNLVHNIRIDNPFIKVITFSENKEPDFFIDCFRNRIAGVVGKDSNVYDLKEYILNETENLLLTNTKLMENNEENKLDINDCIEYLFNDKDKRKINLISHYRGIPIVRNATIFKYDENGIVLITDKAQLKILKTTNHVVISSIHLGVELYLEIININFEENLITLKHSRFLNSYIHRRKNPRVEPINGANLIIVLRNHNIKVEILNISIDHVLCKVDNKFIKELPIDSENEIHIDCKFSNNSLGIKQIKTKSHVKDIFVTALGNKVLFRFDLPFNERKFLDQYISKRSKDVLLELKEMLFK